MKAQAPTTHQSKSIFVVDRRAILLHYKLSIYEDKALSKPAWKILTTPQWGFKTDWQPSIQICKLSPKKLGIFSTCLDVSKNVTAPLIASIWWSFRRRKYALASSTIMKNARSRLATFVDLTRFFLRIRPTVLPINHSICCRGQSKA